jgi:DNA-binding transcriptional regulator/RsmH inhibitor MraZ
MNPTIQRFLNRVNYFGAVGTLDAQGRVVIQPLLRRSAEINGDVSVLGHYRYLDVWNHDRIKTRLESEPVTEEDQKVLASFDI